MGRNTGYSGPYLFLARGFGSTRVRILGVPIVARGALTDNGGVTATHELLSGSAAIAAGDDDFCASTDQRGVDRIEPNRCDAGAFELGDTLLRDGFA
jgi:hypothetical protein